MTKSAFATLVNFSKCSLRLIALMAFSTIVNMSCSFTMMEKAIKAIRRREHYEKMDPSLRRKKQAKKYALWKLSMSSVELNAYFERKASKERARQKK